jgi:hypothetical protein
MTQRVVDAKLPGINAADPPRSAPDYGSANFRLWHFSDLARCPTEPVCSCAFSYVQLAHETAGAARTRLSLRPLLFWEGAKLTQTSGGSRRENANA